MHEREDTKDAYTETIRRAAGGSLYNGDELATPRQDSWRGQTRDTNWALLGDSGEGCETEVAARQTADEENRRLASAILNPRLWSFVKYGSRNSLPAIAGVYCVLTPEDVMLYIGQSTNICQRWRGHHLRQQLRAGKSLRIAWRETFSEAGRLKMEALLIRQHQPRLNANLLPRLPKPAATSMSKKLPRVMTAKQFAEQMSINYRTALNWLEANLVPGAERKPSPVGEYWEIPDTALKMERPRRGMEGNELQQRREALGMSRDELAKALQTTSVSVWRWENGERAIPPYLPLALETVERNHQSNGIRSPKKGTKK